MRPHPDHFNHFFRFQNLIDQAMLDVYAAGVSSGQISEQLFIRKKFLKWISKILRSLITSGFKPDFNIFLESF
jgi:hypothetical protein